MASSKSATRSEAQIKRDIRAWLTRWKSEGAPVSWFWPAGGAFGKSGVEDLVLCIGGIYVAVEVKRPGGQLTPLQAARAADVSRSGGVSARVESVEQFKDLISGFV